MKWALWLWPVGLPYWQQIPMAWLATSSFFGHCPPKGRKEGHHSWWVITHSIRLMFASGPVMFYIWDETYSFIYKNSFLLNCFSFHNLRELNSSKILDKESLWLVPPPLTLDEWWLMLVPKLWFFLVGGLQKVKETMVETSQINTKRGVKDKVKTNW